MEDDTLMKTFYVPLLPLTPSLPAKEEKRERESAKEWERKQARTFLLVYYKKERHNVEVSSLSSNAFLEPCQKH